MSLLSTRRDVDQLCRALDGDLAQASPATAALAALGDRLRSTGSALEAVAVPREDFRAALRTRLVAVATVQPVAAPTPSGVLAFRGRAQKSMGVAAGALASVVVVSGVAVASTTSLPGDPFYGLKRTAEGLQLQLAGDAVDEGDLHLQLAARRLDEVRGLALGRDVDASEVGGSARAGADWDLVRDTLAAMDAETRDGSRLLEQAWYDDRDPQALEVLAGFAEQQAADLQALLPAIAAVRDDAEASLDLVTDVQATSSELRALVGCTDACQNGSSTPGDCDCPSTPGGSPTPSATTGSSATPAPTGGTTGPAVTGGPTDPGEPSAPSSPSPSSGSTPPPVPTLPPAPTPLPTEPLPSSPPTGLPSAVPSGTGDLAPGVPGTQLPG